MDVQCERTQDSFDVRMSLRIESESNMAQGWRAKRKARGHYRSTVCLVLRAYAHQLGIVVPRPAGCVVTLTRIAPRELDDDNLRSAFKAVRDGVADWLGCDDSKRSGVTWCYDQKRGGVREFGARIRVSWGDAR